ncbi:chemotaxis protein CheA [Sphingomonas sp. BAUL-RG-20F-R05-02]|uniref:chemotaxis protein CheA n=1 Tax=Sphingomonas sp. BAUL-RG-20F-R05-02 TaxID=2914830 RepID=UPI001F5A91C3|nr:chemotaxis protein CheA [Sphingomonas sp. BAUL-RG-20F-R05-02]
MSDGFDDIQAIFFEECAEGLACAEQGLTEMAAGAASADVVGAVFRAVHSIKGGSGAFGHDALLAFSHSFENLLDAVRGGRIEATPAVAQVMLAALDVLSDHVAAARGEAPLPDDATALAALEAVLAGGEAAAAAPAAATVVVPVTAPADDDFGFVPVGVDFDLFDDFAVPAVDTASEPGWRVRFVPSRAALANAGEPLLVIRELERLGGIATVVTPMAVPPLRDLDPEDAYIGWTIALPASVAEQDIAECFDFVVPDAVVDIVREVSAAPPAPLAPPASVAPPPLSPVVAVVECDSCPPLPPEPPSVATESRAAEAPTQTIRIDVAKLDMLLNLVGELVIRNSILSDRLAPVDQQRAELPQLTRLTREIQDNVMSLRAQPLRQSFSRVPRMLRDLCAETSKRVALEISGENTEVDKSVIEKIGDPLTHMIRNAVDHGIERCADRIAAGKPAEGRLTLSAEQRGARIIIRVRDDGRGIDRARVLAKAIEMGLVAPDAVLTDEEIDQLICAPGFSTAEKVSNISGRGVGMDVVRSNVEALGGRIEIESEPGVGTVFTMILPLTLAILDGMIIRLAGQRYVLPLASVVESVRPEPGQVRRVTPAAEVIELRGEFVPVKRLGDLFAMRREAAPTPEESIVIMVDSDVAGRVGLMVDTIEERREVVIKSLDRHLYPIRGLGGATILGDGSIALIMDVDALVAAAPVATAKYTMKGLAA